MSLSYPKLPVGSKYKVYNMSEFNKHKSNNKPIKSTKYNRLKRAKKKASEGYQTREMYRFLFNSPMPSFYTMYVPYDKEPSISDTHLYTMIHGKGYMSHLSKPVAVLPNTGGVQ